MVGFFVLPKEISMKLSGNYSLDDLVRALQGNFSCQSETDKTDSHEYVSVEYFFLRAEIDSTGAWGDFVQKGELE